MPSTIRGSDNFDTAGGNAVKAWVNFNGTGTVAIRAAYNVSSITDVQAGIYVVNFTTAMSDANYAPLAWFQTAADANWIKASATRTTAGFGFEYSNSAGGNLTDPPAVFCAVFR